MQFSAFDIVIFSLVLTPVVIFGLCLLGFLIFTLHQVSSLINLKARVFIYLCIWVAAAGYCIDKLKELGVL